MSYESTIGSLGTYLMGMSSLGLYNNMGTSSLGLYNNMGMPSLSLYNNAIPMGYLPFSNVLSGVLGALYANDLNTQNITGFRTISADSALQKELNKLGYGNMMILISEEYQKQVEENADNAQKIGDTFKKWKANYNTANAGKSQTQSTTGNRRGAITGASHNHFLGDCAFGMRV